ncbi:DUF433 domain-containing protein [Candidatus Poriferisodalis sp.]|uniref:DUF433 domain-containing protein n=1 Tax=Candidatus Poriferisodalis sp. TaxID=3101277 RepID=UPI003B5B78B7
MTSVPEMHETPASEALDEGIYSLRQAVGIVARNRDFTRSQVRRWLTVVKPPSHGKYRRVTISFLDLIGLEMLCRFRDEGASLQRVRKVLEGMRARFPDLRHPLAQEAFYTDGHSVWIDFDGHVEEIVGNFKGHMAIREAIKSFAEEIRFVDGRATSWSVAPSIEIDPRVSFGDPVIQGTRVPVRSIVSCLEVDPPERVARGFEVSLEEVEACAAFASQAQ